MKNLIQTLFVALFIVSCNKDKVPAPKTPAIPEPAKWEVIPGDYKVYDTTGIFLYDMSISHSVGTSSSGYRVDTLHYLNFDGNFNFNTVNNAVSIYPNNISIGSYTALHDSIDNRWDIFDMGTDTYYNNFRNDSIIFYFEKHNMPYWINDGTFYFYGRIKHIAVKQH